MNKFEEYKASFKALITIGHKMLEEFYHRHHDDKDKESSAIRIEDRYQNWYTESYLVMKQLLPDRLDEFVHLYKGDIRRKGIDIHTYTIQDWLNGIRSNPNYLSGEKPFNDFAVVYTHFSSQLDILRSVEVRFDSILADIKQLAHADLFDSELDAAKELMHKKFLRAAGAVAGVVLERHLHQVCDNHNIKIGKKKPTIGDFSGFLRQHEVVDVPQLRQIQILGDIRNICTHDKERAPTRDEVDEFNPRGCKDNSHIILI